MDIYDNKLLIKIAEMYYLENQTQSQISKQLNIHRSTISRLLKRTRDEEIVTISINYDLAETYHLEKELEERFLIKKAIVVPTAPELNREQKDLLLAKGLDGYLKTILEDGMILGLSWGATLSKVSYGLSEYNLNDILCVPMIGGPSGKLKSEYHVNTITYEIAKKLNGRSLLIDSPAFPETLSLKKGLMENAFNQKILGLWQKLDLAIMGIGSPRFRTNETWKQFYGDNVFHYLEEKRVAGDVVSRFFDDEGHPLTSELDDQTIGIDSQALKQIPYKIGIAESVDKVQAIISALKGNYVNVLVTTEETAKSILLT